MTIIPIKQEPVEPPVRAVILPTRSMMDDVVKLAHGIGLYDYDIDEMMMHVLNALRWCQHYPTTLPDLITSGYNETERETFNEMISTLYHRMFKILRGANMYDEKGELRWITFREYKGDLVLEMEI